MYKNYPLSNITTDDLLSYIFQIKGCSIELSLRIAIDNNGFLYMGTTEKREYADRTICYYSLDDLETELQTR